MRSVRPALVLAVGVLLAAAAGGLRAVDAAAAPAVQPGPAVRLAVRESGRRWDVPARLLTAMGYVNTHWRMPPRASLDGGWGIMHLVDRPGDRELGVAARLTRQRPEALRRDARANVEGGAALLAHAAGATHPATLTAWYRAVAQVGAGNLYAEQVFAALHVRVTAAMRAGAAPLEARARAARSRSVPAGSDYPFAVWLPASPANYTFSNRPTTYPITRIVIHVTEGAYASAISWFENPAARASANYVIRSSDGAVTQMVHHSDIAWHAGNWAYNTTSIGIEHEALTSDCSWYTPAMYGASARLVATLVTRYGIPIDRGHIIGHSDVPDPNHPGEYGGADHHTDPGPCWNWTTYLALVRQYAGTAATPRLSSGVPARFQETVDNRTPGRFSASPAWHPSHVTGRHYGSDYRYARAGRRRDAAHFRFAIPTTGTYAVYARWPASRRFARVARMGIRTTSGTAWRRVDERRTGGRWVLLGTYALTAGDAPTIQVSRRTSGRGFVIADAFRIRATG